MGALWKVGNVYPRPPKSSIPMGNWSDSDFWFYIGYPFLSLLCRISPNEILPTFHFLADNQPEPPTQLFRRLIILRLMIRYGVNPWRFEFLILMGNISPPLSISHGGCVWSTINSSWLIFSDFPLIIIACLSNRLTLAFLSEFTIRPMPFFFRKRLMIRFLPKFLPYLSIP